MAQVVLLATAIVATIFGHRRVRPAWTIATCVAIGVVSGVLDAGDALDALRPLRSPLGFLAAAVPIAVLLDHVGFFEAAARRIPTGRRCRSGSGSSVRP